MRVPQDREPQSRRPRKPAGWNPPWQLDQIAVPTGERYDLYVEGDNPGIWDFHSHGGGYRMGGFAQSDWAFPGGMMTMLVYEDFEPVHYVTRHHTGAATAGDYALFAHAHKGHGGGHLHTHLPHAADRTMQNVDDGSNGNPDPLEEETLDPGNSLLPVSG